MRQSHDWQWSQCLLGAAIVGNVDSAVHAHVGQEGVNAAEGQPKQVYAIRHTAADVLKRKRHNHR